MKWPRRPPDGYTLLLSNTAPISISPFMLDKSPYDPIKSFTHIAYIGSVPNVFVVNPSVPAKTMTELVAWIKAQTKPVNYGSGGVGSIGHIVGEMFKQQYGLNMEHVPYKGSGPMHSDLLGGTLQFAVDTLTQNVPFIKDGKLVGIAVTSRQRMAMAPNVPTVIEAGFSEARGREFPGHLRTGWRAEGRRGESAQGGQRGRGPARHFQAPGRHGHRAPQDDAGRVRRLCGQAGGRVGPRGEGFRRQIELSPARGTHDERRSIDPLRRRGLGAVSRPGCR
jgi:hypothetical protein